MKITYSLAAAIALLLLPARAQVTNSMPPLPTSSAGLVQTVVDYFTAQNTNLADTFGANRFTLWAGVANVQNADIPIENELGLSYDLFKGAMTTNYSTIGFFGLEAVFRNGGVTGSLISYQGGLEAGAVLVDTRLTGYIDGGWDSLPESQGGQRAFGEAGLRVSKALGHHFFAGVGLGFRFPDSAQIYSAFAGATF
jgi:hypothetical protein